VQLLVNEQRSRRLIFELMAHARKINMVDLRSQYLDNKAEFDSAIQDVLTSTRFINGPIVESFATELGDYVGAKHVIPCGNGTDALQLALMALKLQPGDEVIVPAFTYIAPIEVIALLGLKPVLVDVNPQTFNIDVSLIENAISSKTKAIIPVHLFGQCCEMEEIMALATKHDLVVIEDSAQSIGSMYEGATIKGMAGAIGHIGCMSFFPSKNLGAYGDGGAVFTDNDELAKLIKGISQHGQTEQKYVHSLLGVNSRLDAIQAAILRVKLNYLDDYKRRRQKVAALYNEHFQNCEGLLIPECTPGSDHVYHQYTLKLERKNRDDFKEYLSSHGIPSMVYYPLAAHKQPAFNLTNDRHSISESLCHVVISLPVCPYLKIDDQLYIIEKVKAFFND